jgi:indole-3-acetate monooxygenase
MRGTGSNDFRAKDLFIPEEHTFSFFEPAKRDGVLWRRPTTFIPKMSGVPLGAARAVIDLVSEAMQSKIEFPGGRPYKNLARIQSAIADAEMQLGAARAYVFAAVEREWYRLEHHEVLTEKERADSWLSRINVAQAAREVIRMLYDAVGGSAIYTKKGPFVARFAMPKPCANTSPSNAGRSNGSARCCSSRMDRPRFHSYKSLL